MAFRKHILLSRCALATSLLTLPSTWGESYKERYIRGENCIEELSPPECKGLKLLFYIPVPPAPSPSVVPILSGRRRILYTILSMKRKPPRFPRRRRGEERQKDTIELP